MTDTPTEREEGSGWTKLRRRKVVQWGLAYAAGAWALLQGLEYITNTFHWPELVQQFSTLALLVCLPIVVVIAWYHGDRGEQRVSGAELTIIVLLLLLAGGFLWHYRQPGEKSAAPGSVAGPVPAATTPAAAPAVADTRPSIAVLPFENRSRLDDDVFFVDGIHDDILTQLSKVSALKVISRTSVEKFRDTQSSTKEIAEQLGVRSILEGGVQRAGDRVRINVQLIDAASDAHLWAESYDRELTAANIFAIQSEVATAIAAALKATLSQGEQLRLDAIPTQNLEAWENYQLGRQRLAKRSSEALTEAEGFFRKAVELDPDFALGYVGLSDALVLQSTYGNAPREIQLARADEAVAMAMKLDPNLGEAWTSAGFIAERRYQWDRAEEFYRRAIDLNPNDARAHHWYGRMLKLVGRVQQARIEGLRAVELDPLSAAANASLSQILAANGDFGGAEERALRSVTIDPGRPLPYWQLAMLRAHAFGRFDAAVPLVRRAMELDPSSPIYPTFLGGLYVELGDREEAGRILQESESRWPANQRVRALGLMSSIAAADVDAANRYAVQVLETDPTDYVALAWLRDGDLKRGTCQSAIDRYRKGFPDLLDHDTPKVDGWNYQEAIDLVPVLRRTGDEARARKLLAGAERAIQSTAQLGADGYGISAVQVHALRGDRAKALTALRTLEKAGWRGFGWHYNRDFDPTLALIRDEPEFRAVFADIERDMARQRAELAQRPKDAPLDLDPSR
jgi:TolB-like protein/Tfp pilus assembly protein PilF